jgi:hypothetical protein
MNIVSIKSLDELISWEGEILNLFQRAFNRPLSPEVWRWIYRDNPNGLAHVTLAVEDGRLVGHYAAVPTLFVWRDRSLKAYRSMTTMIDPASKIPGLFLRLGSIAHDELAQSGTPLIYGFPNGNSTHTFGRFLKWTLAEPEWIVDLDGRALLEDSRVQAHLLNRGEVRWAMDHEEQARWRLLNPIDRVRNLGGLIVKMHEGRTNILHLDESGLSKIDPEGRYRVMLASDLCEGTDRTPAFPYQFGYRWLGKIEEAAVVKAELIMSDVF